ncbi:MAG TPA: hypothetical protein VEU52_00030 [Candidatus Limnocylindrales bacterium]|nr:hypothetical protein [Candidatus Limnocylindrales bacterium]
MPLFARRGSSPARKRVSQDWFASLPREKSQLFDTVVQQWECSHAMMSVALSDALSLRARGEIVCAREQVVMASDLLARLADILIGACRTIANYGRQNPSAPAVEPLKTSYFRGSSAKDAASWNSFLHIVLFGSRSRFLQKLRILSGAIEGVSREFDQAVEELTAYSLPADESWEAVDSLHYDLSTCLRELEVVFKSLLRTLPSDHVPALAGDLSSSPLPHRDRSRSRELAVSVQLRRTGS